MSAEISVIVRTNNDRRIIRETLDSVFAQRMEKPVEYILVDEGSLDGTIEVAKRYPFDEIVLLETFRCGSHTLNQAYAKARGDLIINVLGHTVPKGLDSFQILLDTMGSPQVGAAYGRQLPHTRGNPFRNVDFRMGYDEERRERHVLSLAFSILRKRIWDSVPFDETFVAVEDKAYVKKIIQQGFKIIYEPTASVYHCDTFDWSWFLKRSWREAKAGRRMGFSRRGYYLSIPAKVLDDWRYLDDKKFIFVSPFYRAATALAYLAGWYFPWKRQKAL